MEILGEGSYIDTAGRRHNVEGIGSIPDDTPLKSLTVEGTLSFKNVSCDEVKVEGECSGNSLKAKRISIEGSIKVNSINVEDNLQIEGLPKITDIEAKDILIESRDGLISSLKCNKLKIFHKEINEVSASILSRIFGAKSSHHSNSRVRIEHIDAKTVHLENCSVDVIRCENAFIGSNCVIDKLFISGECKVADGSTVGETIYTNTDV